MFSTKKLAEGGQEPLTVNTSIQNSKKCTKHSIYPCKICTKLFETFNPFEKHIMQVDGNQSCPDSDLCSESLQSFHLFRDSDSYSSSSDDNIDEISEQDEEECNIPVITNTWSLSNSGPPPPWYDAYHPCAEYRAPVRKRIQRDNRLNKSSMLPIISVSNLRSRK